MYYDPRGNVIRTVNPDNSEQWVIHGKPDTLSSVAIKNSWSFRNYAPTPWESYTYDANDLAALTNGTSYGHDFTPKNTTTDAFGRTVKTTDNETTADAQNVVMKYEYDIRGNLLRVTDALNRIAFEYTYDLRPQPKKEGEEEKKLPPIHTWHIDSGNKQSLFDASGKAIELSDAKGAQTLSSYDTINRPNNIWARDKSAEIITLRQYLIYGDSAGLINPENNNYLGKLYRHYDEAGLQQVNNYDFKGNITEKTRKVISDTELLSVFGGATVDCYRVDWTGLNTAILDSAEHKTNSAYDALNRIIELIYPEDVEAKRKVLLPVYNNAGALERVELLDDIGSTSIPYVNHIAYNAKGQRLLAAYGNGVMTRYTYDKKTFRLKRLRSETYSQNNFEFTSGGSIKQDTVYSYDLAGNIITTNEATTSCGVAGSNTLTRNFVYDSLYRLLSATGRENAPTITPVWDDSYRSSDESVTTAYTQNYAYDKMGNILSLQHIGANNFTRNFNYNSNHNKLESIDIGATNYAFTYDANGNQLAETTSRKFEWDYADRMRSFYVEASGSITQYTHYLYDASGNRVKKLTRTQSGDYDSVTYIDGILEYKTDGHDEQNTLHIMDDKSRIASVRIGDNFGDTTPEIKYNLEDHLGSSLVQLEANGALVNKEEYYPFGETSFGSYAQKRYKFCGKERDNESGLYYYGARYYNAWTCRFVSVDPLKDKYTYYTPYQYAGNKPINFIDLDGLEEGDPPLNTTESKPPLTDSSTVKPTITSEDKKIDIPFVREGSNMKGTGNIIIVMEDILVSDDKVIYNEGTIANKLKNSTNKNWDYIVVDNNYKGLVDFMKAYKEKYGSINNIVIRTHGRGRVGDNYNEAFIGGDKAAQIESNNGKTLILKEMAKCLSSDATIVVTSCGAGQTPRLAKAFAQAMNVALTDRKVFFNRSLTFAGGVFWLDTPLTRKVDFSGGWVWINKLNIQSKDPKDAVQGGDSNKSGYNITLNSSGKPITISAQEIPSYE